MKHSRILLAAVAVGALALGACSSGGGSGGTSTSKTESGPIQIGMVTPLTGRYAALGAGDKAAAEQMVKKVNDAGGIDGRKLELTVQDDKTDVTQSVTLFNQMAANKDISLILTSANVSASVAVGSSAERVKMPILALGPVSAFADGSNKYAFTVPATPELYAQEMVEYLKSTDVKTIAIGYDGKDVYGKTGNDATKSAAEKAGIKIVLDEPYDSTATDFTPLITHVKDSKADGLLVWGSGPAPVIITKTAAAAGIKLFMTGSEATTLYTKPAGSAAEGVAIASAAGVAAAAMPSGPYKSMLDEFATTYKENNNGVTPPQFAFDGASGVQLAVAAIKKAGSSNREKIRNALDHINVLTMNGRYKYSPSDHTGLTTDALAVVIVKNGEFTASDFTVDQFKSSLPK